MLWACQTTRANSSWRLPKSICTHCVPLRRKMMLWSDASLSPSVSLAKLSAGTFLSLQVILTLVSAAMFFRSGGTIIGARGLSERGSTLGPSWRSLGVPLKAGAGSLIASGTMSPVASAAGTVDARRRFRSEGERLAVGAELEVFGCSLEGGGWQFDRQRHHVAGGVCSRHGRGEEEIQDSDSQARQQRERHGSSQWVASCIHIVRHAYKG